MRSQWSRTRDHFVVPLSTRIRIFLPVRFCWERILWSVVSSRSKAASSAAFNRSPLFSCSQPICLAVDTVWPGSSCARPRGVPWSKRMSIGRRRGLERDGWLEALGYEVKDRLDLLASHVELFHHFGDAHVFEVLEDGCYGQAGIAEDPGATDFAGDAFDGGALRPIEIRHSRPSCFIMPQAPTPPMRDEAAHEWGTRDGLMGGPPAQVHHT